MGKAEEKLEKKIKDLYASAKSCLEMRASLGRGYRGMTDELLQKANNYEAQARELKNVLNELKEEA